MFKSIKKKIEIFEHIDSSRKFEKYLKRTKDRLICAEVYCEFSGWCTALDKLFNSMKLDWSNGEIVLLKVLADDNDTFKRFQNQSEPIFLFILNNKITTVFRGVDKMRFEIIAKREIEYYNMFKNGIFVERPLYDIDEATPEEKIWLKHRDDEAQEEVEATAKRRASRQAERKRYRAQLMAAHLKNLNFVLYWPHAKHAHPELYERWDMNNIIMVNREEIQLTEDVAKDLLYAGDAPVNEASIHALLAAPALAICFRLLDEDKHFVSLVRRILYEDLPTYDDTKLPNEQLPKVTAYEYYKSYSLAKEKILEMRRDEKQQKKLEIIEKRARRLSELQRLAKEAIQDAIHLKRMAREQKKLDLLKTGNLEALQELDEQPEDDEVSIVVPEELPDALEEEESDTEDEMEYFPPAGLEVPGLYSPPNDIAKANGLAILFPKTVLEYVAPKPEFLPPHVLVILDIVKRHKAVKAVSKYKNSIIHMGIFKIKSLSPYQTKLIANTVKQFENMNLPLDEDTKLLFMMSTATDFGLLELVDLGPDHVSRNSDFGEDECSAVFPVDYGENVQEFEDFDDLEE